MPDTSRPAPLVTLAGDAPAYWERGALWEVLLSGQATLGQFTLLEQLMPEGNGPPPHVHERMAEGFYVLDGAIDVSVEGETVHVETGAALWVPPGVAHGFTVTSETTRVLNFYNPGGFDDRLPFTATSATSRTLPPPGFRDAHDPAAEERFRARIRDLHQETSLGDPIP